MNGIELKLSLALLTAMVARCGQVEEEEARELAAELIAIVDTYRAWCRAHPERQDTEFTEEDVVFTVIRTAVGCWPRAEGWKDDERNTKVHDEGDESVWLMCHLTDVSDELYERYLKLSDKILGEDLASLLHIELEDDEMIEISEQLRREMKERLQ
jgi:hypothetical protein